MSVDPRIPPRAVPRAREQTVRVMAPWAIAGLFVFSAGVRAQAPVTTLEADALLSGRPSEGVLVLRGGHGNSELVDADALVFFGANADGSDADVLTVTVGVREPHGLGRMRAGRFVLATGAVRPVHLDGVSALGRMPTGT